MKKILFILIFLEGFLLMGVELSSSLLLKPYFGGSLEVWTFILGITTASLALGYFFGSWLSKKKDSLKIIYFLFFALAFLIFLMPFISKGLFRSLFEVEITTMLTLVVPPFLFPPLFVLGAISTLIVKLVHEEGVSAGDSAAKTYAISTISGVLSLLLLAFILIDNFSTIAIIYLLSFIALMAVVLLKSSAKEGKLFYPFVAFYIFISLIYFTKGGEQIKDVFPGNVKEIYRSDGLIGQIVVLKDYNYKTKTLMVNNSVQSTTDFNNFGNYVHVKDITNFIKQTNKKGKILVAGLGGGSLVKELSKENQYIDVLEIDKRMIEVCRDHYELPQGKNIHYIIDDARHFINKSSEKYDIIVLDLSIGGTIPSNVYTKEAFQKMKTMLNKGGIILLNFFSKDTQQGLLAVNSVGKTFQKAGLHVKLLNKVVDTLHQSAFIFYATSIKEELPVIDSLTQYSAFENGVLLTDNESKLDNIHKEIVMNQRRDYIYNYQKYFSELRD